MPNRELLEAAVDVLVTGEVVEVVARGAGEVDPLEAFEPLEEQLAPMITTRPTTRLPADLVSCSHSFVHRLLFSDFRH